MAFSRTTWITSSLVLLQLSESASLYDDSLLLHDIYFNIFLAQATRSLATAHIQRSMLLAKTTETIPVSFKSTTSQNTPTCSLPEEA